jgi:hypothetical protein
MHATTVKIPSTIVWYLNLLPDAEFVPVPVLVDVSRLPPFPVVGEVALVGTGVARVDVVEARMSSKSPGVSGLPIVAVGQGRFLNDSKASSWSAPVTVTTAVALQPPSIVVPGRISRLTAFLRAKVRLIPKRFY